MPPLPSPLAAALCCPRPLRPRRLITPPPPPLATTGQSAGVPSARSQRGCRGGSHIDLDVHTPPPLRCLFPPPLPPHAWPWHRRQRRRWGRAAWRCKTRSAGDARCGCMGGGCVGCGCGRAHGGGRRGCTRRAHGGCSPWGGKGRREERGREGEGALVPLRPRAGAGFGSSRSHAWCRGHAPRPRRESLQLAACAISFPSTPPPPRSPHVTSSPPYSPVADVMGPGRQRRAGSPSQPAATGPRPPPPQPPPPPPAPLPRRRRRRWPRPSRQRRWGWRPPPRAAAA